jgi:proline iminopeptidase
MVRSARLSAVLLVLLSTGIASTAPVPETVLDGIIRTAPDLVRDVPRMPPRCDAFEGTKGWVDVGDVALYREEEGEGPAIVLVHGGPGGTHHGFHPWFSDAARFARVVAYDQRGCGRSDRDPTGTYSLRQAVRDLEALRSALDIERWTVLGWSYGGVLAQLYALEHPDRLDGLVLVGSAAVTHLDAGPSRQWSVLSKEERVRIVAVARDRRLTTVQQVFNRQLNGDWKRQSFFRPGRDEMARRARYGWVHDPAFREAIGRELSALDLEGAFRTCPVPTLIVEGEHDRTWGPRKAAALHAEHPGARLVVLDRSAHAPFADEPGRFFSELAAFLRYRAPVDRDLLEIWRSVAARRLREHETSPAATLASSAWGRRGSAVIAERYEPSWLAAVERPSWLLRLAFALYDEKLYEDARLAFEALAKHDGGPWHAIGLLWQGHVLDLAGRREEALRAYRQVIALGVKGGMTHDQYGMTYEPDHWARERLKEPFRRVENIQP